MLCVTYTPFMQTDPQEDYARGWVPFLDCRIYLDSRPLIPRLETEYWVEEAIQECSANSGQGSAMKCLDLFAGSGAIGVAVLKHLPGSRVDFGEIDTEHFPTIKKNITENGVDETRARIIETDVWSMIPDRYDYVFANPPYLDESRRARIQDSVLAHEPASALFAEEGGFSLIRRTMEGLREHLLPGGILYIEHDPEQTSLLASLATSFGLVAETRTDQFGLDRFTVISVA